MNKCNVMANGLSLEVLQRGVFISRLAGLFQLPWLWPPNVLLATAFMQIDILELPQPCVVVVPFLNEQAGHVGNIVTSYDIGNRSVGNDSDS